MSKKKNIIIGAGLSGLSLNYFLHKKRKKAYIFEKEKEPGGLCRSIHKRGFIFDYSGHILHFRNPKILALVKKIIGGNLVKHKRNAYVRVSKKYIPYPFQVHFNYLSKKIAQDCLSNFMKVSRAKKSKFAAKNLLEWINKKFGAGIARYFMIPYNQKFWRFPLQDIMADWAERFVVVPSPDDFKHQSNDCRQKNYGYNHFFWYPKQGGIEELVGAFSRKTEKIELNQRLTRINLTGKSIEFESGRKEKFDTLVSTMPLPELGRITEELPKGILSSLDKLNWLSVYNINLGVTGSVWPKSHWVYFPQKNIPFFRVGFFHNFSLALTPKNSSSLYIELTYLGQKDFDQKTILSEVELALRRTGILKSSNKICCCNVNDLKYAYVIYDKQYTEARKKILQFFLKNNIIVCGRFGGWRYLSMEDVIIESKKISGFL